MCFLAKSANDLMNMLSEDSSRFRATSFPKDVFLKAYMDHRHRATDLLLNKHLSADILSEVIDSASEEELWSIAMKNCLSADQIEQLSQHPNPDIRQRIAYNKAATRTALERLAQDEDPLVSDPAKERLLKIKAAK